MRTKITDDIIKNNKIVPEHVIGVMLSGGMDSALLLFLLAKNYTNPITAYTVPKNDGAADYVDGIIEWVNNKLNKSINPSILIGNPNLYHANIINMAIREIEGKYDYLYFAGNSYPKNTLPNGPSRVYRKDIRHIQPFFHNYKTDILQAYIDYDIMDLLWLTHTCTEKSVGRCNECWQCKERSWAFNLLNINDNLN